MNRAVLAESYDAVGSGLAGINTRWHKKAAACREAQRIEQGGNLATSVGYTYMQPTANVIMVNLATGDVIDMVSAVEIAGELRGILAWEAEQTITSRKRCVHCHLLSLDGQVPGAVHHACHLSG